MVILSIGLFISAPRPLPKPSALMTMAFLSFGFTMTNLPASPCTST